MAAPIQIERAPKGPYFQFGLLCFFALLLASCTHAPVWQAPRIIAPAEWGGTPADATRGKTHMIKHITLHHGGVAFLRDRDPRQYLRNLQSWSRGEKKWMDIPYHYLIDLDGNIYEGRHIDFAGDTNTEYDPSGHALIVVLGNYEEVEPNAAQLSAVVDMMTLLSLRYHVAPETIAGHKDHSAQTVCPGKHLEKFLLNGYFRDAVRVRMQRAASRNLVH